MPLEQMPSSRWCYCRKIVPTQARRGVKGRVLAPNKKLIAQMPERQDWVEYSKDQSNDSMDTGRSRSQPLRLAHSNKGSWSALAYQKSNLLGKFFHSKPYHLEDWDCKLTFALIRTNSRMEIDLGVQVQLIRTQIGGELRMNMAEKMIRSPEITPVGKVFSLLVFEILKTQTNKKQNFHMTHLCQLSQVTVNLQLYLFTYKPCLRITHR